MLKAPKPPRTAWRGRYTDPDSGKEVYEGLDPNGAGRNAQTRKLWAVEKSRQIARRKEELLLGAPKATGKSLKDAIDRYYEDHPRLRPLTSKTYRKATAKLLAWCDARKIKSADQLTLAELVAFRSYLGAAPKSTAVKSGRKGEKRQGAEPRAASAVNVEIRSVKVVLNYLRRAGLLPRCSRDDISDGLQVFDVDRDAPVFLREPELRQLLAAVQAHDGDTLAMESRGLSIAPMVLCALLTGMRYGEIIGLDWREVHLEEKEIHLTSRTKTRTARTVDMSISPALCELLARLHREAGEPGAGRVFDTTEGTVKAAMRRLVSVYAAPASATWQALRRTCGTYLTNAPGIFGAASAYRSARQLGHSVTVAEKHYLGVVKVPREAATLEAAMGIEEELKSICSPE